MNQTEPEIILAESSDDDESSSDDDSGVPTFWPEYRLNSRDKRNMYEIERDLFHAQVAEANILIPSIGRDLTAAIMDYIAPHVCTIQPYFAEASAVRESLFMGQEITNKILDYVTPYVEIAQPYYSETVEVRECMLAAGRVLHGMLDLRILDIVSEYSQPYILISEPIPCAITTIGKIRDFDYKQGELIKAIQERGALDLVDPRILAVSNTVGTWIRPGIPDPRIKHVSKHGRPAKNSGYRLFGTSQTTFWVKTFYRTASKIFAIKVFQRNVNFETLGGLWVDCRDTEDVNRIVLDEMRASLGRPDIEMTDFTASMRNYRFRFLGDHNINMFRIYNIFRAMRATRPEIFPDLNISRYPSVIVEIDEPNHTSKKKRLTIKIFQSGKVNLDSCVFPEHMEYWYKFINNFFIEHPDVTYVPAKEDEYDSDHYYEELGVEPPPRDLVDF